MNSQPKKVLLVDDEEKLLAGLRRRLSFDFKLETAASGSKALQLIEQDPDIAVIMADMQMPEMNGVELLKRVQELRPSIRRLMLTGNSDLETAIAAINEGRVMRFLRKPCEIEDIRNALTQALADHEFQTGDELTAPKAPTSDNGDKARAAFLAMMNHELRTPLNHILGFAQILETKLPRVDDPASFEHLQHIKTSGDHMLTLISRILEFSRLCSAPQKENQAEVVNLVSLVREEAAEIAKAAEAKAITISVNSLRLRADIQGREAEVRMALKELFSNAVKFNVKDGHIGVTIKCGQDSAAVRIVDTGCGVPPAIVNQVGKPFRQADDSYSRRHDGMGLGLALVSTIAQVNGAQFLLRSSESGGAEATMVFQRPTQQSGSANLMQVA